MKAPLVQYAADLRAWMPVGELAELRAPGESETAHLTCRRCRRAWCVVGEHPQGPDGEPVRHVDRCVCAPAAAALIHELGELVGPVSVRDPMEGLAARLVNRGGDGVVVVVDLKGRTDCSVVQRAERALAEIIAGLLSGRFALVEAGVTVGRVPVEGVER